MKSALGILAALVILAGAGVAAVRLADAASPSSKAAAAPKPSPAASRSCNPRAISLFGYIKSLSREGDHYELRFDPALMLSGVTASRAALEDTGSADVPNDNYVVQESDRAYTYLVQRNAHVTVLTHAGSPPFGGTPISVDQLARLVRGGQPVKLFEELSSGLWLRYYNDTACSLDQQYRP